MTMTPAQQAVWFADRLTKVILAAGGLSGSAEQHTHVAGVFSATELALLALPLDGNCSPGQEVSLASEHELFRGLNAEERHASYAEKPRTRVYELIDTGSDGWFGLAALRLADVAGCQVGCSIYQSQAGDGILHPHIDDWYGLIVQWEGSKDWTLWDGPGGQPQYLTTHVGDVLLVPPLVRHMVTTPDRSVHLTFPFRLHKPIRTDGIKTLCLTK